MRKIPDGFGVRLRDERIRLGLTQAALASAGGVQRLAQSQYENGSSAPSVRYLAGVAEVGIDLVYALFGDRKNVNPMPLAEAVRIEAQAFERLESFIASHPGATYGAETRFAMFQLLREELTEDASRSYEG